MCLSTICFNVSVINCFMFVEIEEIQVEMLKVLLIHNDPKDVSNNILKLILFHKN